MYGVNGRPFVSFDDQVDLSVMGALHHEICLGLTQVEGFLERCKCTKDSNECPDLYDYRYKDYADDEITDEDAALMAAMPVQEKNKFLMFKYGVYFPWSFCVQMISPNTWKTKHVTAGKTLSPRYKKLFPKTIEFCYSLPMFEGIGRINLFGVYPDNVVQCHRDLAPQEWLHDDEFVMIAPKMTKPLYIYDDIAKKKHYVKCHVATFNDLDYHGADAIREFSYTIRVDGVFKQDYKMEYGR